MKRVLFTFITVLSLLILNTGTVFAASSADGYLELREVRNDATGAVIFVFDVVGEFSKADFKGSFLTVGDNRYTVDCNLDSSILQCTTSRVTAGQYVTLNIGGFIFWTRVPERSGTISSSSPSSSPEYCYGVYDVYGHITSELEVNHVWLQFAMHCQDTPANYGDMLENFVNPDFGVPFDYEFRSGNPTEENCFDPIIGDAYYGACPS